MQFLRMAGDASPIEDMIGSKIPVGQGVRRIICEGGFECLQGFYIDLYSFTTFVALCTNKDEHYCDADEDEIAGTCHLLF